MMKIREADVPAPGSARASKAGRRDEGKQRRAAPMDPAVARWFARASGEFARSRSATIPLLQSAQTALGYLPPDAMRAIARHVGAAPAVVEGVASFYAQFRFHAPGRHRVTVCSGTACYVRGSGKLMEDLQAELHIAPGATTADGEVTLESVSCFGACALAPVVVLDGEVLRQQTGASVKAALAAVAHRPRTGGTRKDPGRPAERLGPFASRSPQSKSGTDPEREHQGPSPRIGK